MRKVPTLVGTFCAKSPFQMRIVFSGNLSSIFGGCVARFLFEDLVKVGLRGKACFEGDLKQGIVTREDHTLGKLHPFLGYVGKGRDARLFGEKGVKVVGRDVDMACDLGKNAISSEILIHIFLSFEDDLLILVARGKEDVGGVLFLYAIQNVVK